jgi:hypothetical protein
MDQQPGSAFSQDAHIQSGIIRQRTGILWRHRLDLITDVRMLCVWLPNRHNLFIFCTLNRTQVYLVWFQ